MYESTRRMLPILNFSAALNHQPLPLHGKADLLWKSQHPLGFPPTLLAAPFSVFLCIFFSRAINYWVSLGSVLWPFLFLFDVLPYGFNNHLNAENSQIYITTWEHSSELDTHNQTFYLIFPCAIFNDSSNNCILIPSSQIWLSSNVSHLTEWCSTPPITSDRSCKSMNPSPLSNSSLPHLIWSIIKFHQFFF